jgi:hypothetical protein
MIHKVTNLLSDGDLQFLKEICDDFENRNVDKPKGNEGNNSYNRVFVDGEYLNEYYHKLINYLEKNIDKNQYQILDFPKPKTWINKIIPETNKNDSFHYDMSFLTAVTYLNDDFIGGEFTYIDKGGIINVIKPELNNTLVMDKTLYHKVSPVYSGIRFSLITFFNFNAKDKKTIL